MTNLVLYKEGDFWNKRFLVNSQCQSFGPLGLNTRIIQKPPNHVTVRFPIERKSHDVRVVARSEHACWRFALLRLVDPREHM